MSRSTWVVGAFLGLVLLAGVASAGSPSEAVADYAFHRGFRASGALDGYCTAGSLVPQGPGSVEFLATGVRLEEFVTIWNETWVQLGQPSPTRVQTSPFTYSSTTVRMEDGTYGVSWGVPGERVRFFHGGWPAAPSSWLNASFRASEIAGGPSVQRPFPDYYFKPVDEAQAAKADGGVDGWHSAVSIDEAWGMGGEAVVFLQNVSLAGPNGDIPLRAGYEEAWLGPRLAAGGVVQFTERHFLLRADRVQLVLGANWSAACRGLLINTSGVMTLYGAVGEIGVGSNTHVFDDDEFSASGDFTTIMVSRQAAGSGGFAPVDAKSNGDIEGFAVNFVELQWWVAPIGATGAAMGILGILGVLAWLLKGGPRGGSHGHETRGILLGEVRRSPWLRPAELRRRTGVPEGTFRYHMDQLLRGGAVKEWRRGRSVRYVAPKPGVDAVPSYWPSDPAVRVLREKTQGGRRRLGHLADCLRQELGVSRSGAWAILRRLERGKIMDVQRVGRRAWGQCIG